MLRFPELNALVGELLSMTRLDSRQALKAAGFDLRAALADCVDQLEPMQITVSTSFDSELSTLVGDQRLLVRAVGNLLRNAQKYASKQIALAARRSGAQEVEIVVEDDGPGIPAAERERVFEPFYRLDRSRDRATGGFGLGLSIAHKAIALHGGSIRIDDSALGGARFVIRLPAAVSSQDRQAAGG